MLGENNPELLRTVQSDEFLSPVSLWTTLGGLFLLGTFGAAIALATFTKYDVTVKASATVRPTGEIRIVQSALEGSIKNISVKENQIVKKGDLIATIDSSQLQIKKTQIAGNIEKAQQQLVQMDAQIRSLDGQIVAEGDRNTSSVVSAEAELSRQQRDYQERLITSTAEAEEAKASVAVAKNELEKTQAELKSAQANLKSTEVALAVASGRWNRYKSVGEGLSKNQLEEAQLAFEQQQQAVEQQKAMVEGQIQAVERQQRAVEAAIARHNRTLAGLNPNQAIVVMAKEKIAQERATARSSLARLSQERQGLIQRQVEIQTQISNAQKEFKQAEAELEKTTVTSPESGTILKLELRNSGQVLRAGEPIAQIAPSNAPLVIKARVATDDVSKIKVCKTSKVIDCPEGKVLLRVSAYPYPDYGTLKGAVRAITADTITPQNNGNTQTAPYYEVTIEPEKLYLERANQQYFIQPGMEIAADIISKEETVLTFILRKARLLTDL